VQPICPGTRAAGQLHCFVEIRNRALALAVVVLLVLPRPITQGPVFHSVSREFSLSLSPMRKHADRVITVDGEVHGPGRLEPSPHQAHPPHRRQRPHMDHTRPYPGVMIHTPGPQSRTTPSPTVVDTERRNVQTVGSVHREWGEGDMAILAVPGNRKAHGYAAAPVYPREALGTRSGGNIGGDPRDVVSHLVDFEDGGRLGDSQRAPRSPPSSSRMHNLAVEPTQLRDSDLGILSTTMVYPSSINRNTPGRQAYDSERRHSNIFDYNSSWSCSRRYLNADEYSSLRERPDDDSSRFQRVESFDRRREPGHGHVWGLHEVHDQGLGDWHVSSAAPHDLIPSFPDSQRYSPRHGMHHWQSSSKQHEVSSRNISRCDAWENSSCEKPSMPRDRGERDKFHANPSSRQHRFVEPGQPVHPSDSTREPAKFSHERDGYAEHRDTENSRLARPADAQRCEQFGRTRDSAAEEPRRICDQNAADPRYPRPISSMSGSCSQEMYSGHVANREYEGKNVRDVGCRIPGNCSPREEDIVSLDIMRQINCPSFALNREDTVATKSIDIEVPTRVMSVSRLPNREPQQSQLRPRPRANAVICTQTKIGTADFPEIPRFTGSNSFDDGKDVQHRMLQAVNESCQTNRHQKVLTNDISSDKDQISKDDSSNVDDCKFLSVTNASRMTRRPGELPGSLHARPRKTEIIDKRSSPARIADSPSKRVKHDDVNHERRVLSLSSDRPRRHRTDPPEGESVEVEATTQRTDKACPTGPMVSIDLEETVSPQADDVGENELESKAVSHLNVVYDDKLVRDRVSRFVRLASDLHTVNIGFCGLNSEQFGELIPYLADADVISQLYLENNRLESLPNNFATLRNVHRLESIVLQSNLLTEVPGVLQICSNLKFLNLSRNRLTSVPLGLAKLENVQCLELSRNALTYLPGPGFGSMKCLQVLKLDHNHLRTLPDDLGENNPALVVLDLSHNIEFGGGLPAGMRNLGGQLEELTMLDTGIMNKLPRKYMKSTASELVELMAGATEADVLEMIEAAKSVSLPQKGTRQVPLSSKELETEPVLVSSDGIEIKSTAGDAKTAACSLSRGLGQSQVMKSQPK
jgi:Leucine rich repeat